MHNITFFRLAILSFILHWGYELRDTGNVFTSGFAQHPAGELLRTRCFHKSYSNLIHVPQILEIWTEALFEGKQGW